MAYYKILTRSHKGVSIKKYKYTPNKWSTPFIPKPIICNKGYHVATLVGLSYWLEHGSILYLTETKGKMSGRFHKDKRAFSSIKITRRIPITTRKVNKLAFALTGIKPLFGKYNILAIEKLRELLCWFPLTKEHEEIFLKIMLGEEP